MYTIFIHLFTCELFTEQQLSYRYRGCNEEPGFLYPGIYNRAEGAETHKDSCAVTARREMLSAREPQWTLYRRRHLGGALENEIMLFTYTLCKGGGVRTQGNEETRNIF